MANGSALTVGQLKQVLGRVDDDVLVFVYGDEGDAWPVVNPPVILPGPQRFYVRNPETDEHEPHEVPDNKNFLLII